MSSRAENIFSKTILVLLLFFVGCGPESSKSGLMVVSTTSLLNTAVEAVGRKKIDAEVLVPGGICPGHFEISPGDIKKVQNASVVLYQGWEKWLGELTSSAGSQAVAYKVRIGKGENLMVPERYIQAVEQIARVLGSIDTDNREFYDGSAGQYIRDIEETVKAVREMAGDVKGVKVISSQQQSDFLNWLGLDVVAVYGRPEDMSAPAWVKVIDTARRAGVRLVADNLQSGPQAGLNISKELKIPHVTLSNFPLKGSYGATLLDNTAKILEAVKNE